MTAVVSWRTSWLVPLAFAVSFAAPGCDGMATRMRDSGATEAEMSQVRSMAADWRWKHRLLVMKQVFSWRTDRRSGKFCDPHAAAQNLAR